MTAESGLGGEEEGRGGRRQAADSNVSSEFQNAINLRIILKQFVLVNEIKSIPSHSKPSCTSHADADPAMNPHSSPRRSLFVAYFLWATFGIFGAHR
jgi:hypothetical protein